MTLVDDARHWWRMWSIRVHALTAFGVCAALAHPEILNAPLAYVPDYWRPLAVVLVGLLTFALPTAARLLKQSLPDAQ
jgi:hypothetical protein